MGFHEQAVNAGCDGRAGEDRCEFAIAAGGAAEATRTLDGAFAYVAKTVSPARERRTRVVEMDDAEEADDLGPR